MHIPSQLSPHVIAWGEEQTRRLEEDVRVLEEFVDDRNRRLYVYHCQLKKQGKSIFDYV